MVQLQCDPGIALPRTESFENEADVSWSGSRLARSRASAAGFVVAGLVAAALGWSYYPTIFELVQAWNTEPDYSHGYLVPPLAVLFLWVRRDRFPGMPDSVSWAGFWVVLGSVATRYLGARYFLGSVDAWSMLLWIVGVVWLLCGSRVLRWSWPSIAFLWFMVPLPYRAERMLSVPLQELATSISAWVLQTLGQPVWAAENVLLVGDGEFEVAKACCGLRVFMGILALAFACAALVRRTWWESVLIMASAFPIALVVNSTRIVVTVLLAQLFSSQAAYRFNHDLAGILMNLFAGGLFVVLVWYLKKVVLRFSEIDVEFVVSRRREKEHV